MNRVVFSSASVHWETPREVKAALEEEFGLMDDPCPSQCATNGLERPWRSPCFLNPPFKRGLSIVPWLQKARDEAQRGVTVVCLLPSRTDTQWWHEYVMNASEIRFLRGRLKFSGAPYNAPFPSAIVIFRSIEGG